MSWRHFHTWDSCFPSTIIQKYMLHGSPSGTWLENWTIKWSSNVWFQDFFRTITSSFFEKGKNVLNFLPCTPSRKVSLWLECENGESNNDSWREKKCLNDDTNVIKRHDHTDGVSLNNGLKNNLIFITGIIQNLIPKLQRNPKTGLFSAH